METWPRRGRRSNGRWSSIRTTLARIAVSAPSRRGYQTGNYSEALEWYTRAAEAAPDSAIPYRLLGAVRHMMGDYAGAAGEFQRSLGLQPTAAGYTNLGTALFFQGHYRESVQAFERCGAAAGQLPAMGQPRRRVSLGARQCGEVALGAQLARDPSQRANRSRLALYLDKSGDTEAALAELASSRGRAQILPSRDTTGCSQTAYISGTARQRPSDEAAGTWRARTSAHD